MAPQGTRLESPVWSAPTCQEGIVQRDEMPPPPAPAWEPSEQPGAWPRQLFQVDSPAVEVSWGRLVPPTPVTSTWVAGSPAWSEVSFGAGRRRVLAALGAGVTGRREHGLALGAIWANRLASVAGSVPAWLSQRPQLVLTTWARSSLAMAAYVSTGPVPLLFGPW